MLLVVAVHGNAQIKSIGVPNIVNYTGKDYNASTQNWAATQDKRGVIYFGNNDGLLEFDGVNWRLIQMPNTSVVRSIAKDRYGTIYVGAFGEFGYLKADDNGLLNYVSLLDLIPDDLKNFGDIWKIHETESGIIFQSLTEIFLYNGEKVRAIAQKRDFFFSFYVNGELYITERNKGLLRLKDEKLIAVEGGEVFNNNISTMLPFDETKILIGTTDQGLYLLEDGRINKWETAVNDFFIENQIYCAAKVKDYFAFGTILNGLLIIDDKGVPVQHINREKGLQNNTILSIYADNYDNLWLGLDNGIDYIMTNSAFTNIVNKSKIGAGYSSIIFENKLYLGTNQGLFFKEWEEPANPLNDDSDFQIVKNTQGQVWNLYKYGNTLFCGQHNGTYIIKDGEARKISDVMGGWIHISFPDKKNILVEGTYTGLMRFEKNDHGEWTSRKIPGFNESSRIIESYMGRNNYILWISHGYKGIYRVELNDNLDSILNIDFYDAGSGLQTSLGNNVMRFHDEIIFSNNTGIYSFNEENQQFSIYTELINLFGQDDPLLKLVSDNTGRVWFVQGEELGMVKKLNDGSYQVRRTQFKSFAGNFVGGFEHLNPYNDESLIIATEEGFAHYQSTFSKDTDIPLHVLIRSIYTTNDSLLFGGAFTDSLGYVSEHQLVDEVRELPYSLNNFKIEFSATHYENLDDVQYQYYLEGFEENWSDWSDKTMKEYTNLREGDYTFYLKAKDVNGLESETISYSFVIEPPWYRSLLAYISYVVFIICIVWIIIRGVRKRIEREKRVLHIHQKRELHQQKVNHENEVLSAQQEIDNLKNEKLRVENEKNKAEVELKTKELASYAMQITQKNETLQNMKEQLNNISKKVNPDAQRHLQKLIKNIEKSTSQKEDWEKFEGYFDQVYEDFTRRLRDKYPNLTPNDIKLCAYLRMNLTTKEIAPLLNISVRGVEVSRYRLRKKMNLSKDQNLIEFMMNL